ncbi:MAG: sialidase family protein [Bacteroidota bacterium]
MNKLVLTLSLIWISTFTILPAQDIVIPALISPTNPALVKEELIYSLDQRPTPECHASTIVEVSDGMVAAWFGGTYERHSDVGIWVSIHRGNSWSKPIEVANGFQNDSLRYPTWNPVLFKPEGGPLLLFYKVGPNPREWWGMLTSSADEGRTWSYPVKLGENPAIGHLLGPVKNKPIQLSDGSLLCPSSTEVEDAAGTRWRVHFERSTDLGKSWEVYGPINDGLEFDAIQPSILTYPNGSMQVLCRSMQGVLAQSWSKDGGKKWTPMRASMLPNPSAGTDAITLKDGRQLLVYNHTRRKGDFPKGRNMLNVALSDNGEDWKPVLTLERQEGEYSYPAVIQHTDGNIHITYTYQRRTIKYVVLDPDKMK